MDINQLIAIIKKKLLNQIEIDNILIEDKSFLHKNHPGNNKNKFHLKISLKSKELKKMLSIKVLDRNLVGCKTNGKKK